MLSVHVRISGRVQGVGYRAWTIDTATRLGLKGWVRNVSDGTVEAVFQGDAAVIDRMLAKCADGPLLARVADIRRNDRPHEPAHSGFTGRDTVSRGRQP